MPDRVPKGSPNAPAPALRGSPAIGVHLDVARTAGLLLIDILAF
jgi:hypothetical protein